MGSGKAGACREVFCKDQMVLCTCHCGTQLGCNHQSDGGMDVLSLEVPQVLRTHPTEVGRYSPADYHVVG